MLSLVLKGVVGRVRRVMVVSRKREVLILLVGRGWKKRGPLIRSLMKEDGRLGRIH